MAKSITPLRVGIFGSDEPAGQRSRGCGLWPAGYAAAVTAAGAAPAMLETPKAGATWTKALNDLDGVVYLGGIAEAADEKRFFLWCRDHELPLLAVDEGMLALNNALGGTHYLDLPLDLPEALQHRHPPESELRHAIHVFRETLLASVYGEGEIVVNSAHRRAVNRLARGFRVSARALDGVVEAIEPENGGWFALGVQWQPAAASASGLDIQLFRGLVQAGRQPVATKKRAAKSSAA